MTDTLTIRPAEEREVPLILAFVRELADYERLSNEVVATEADMREALFGTRPYAEVVFACLNGDRRQRVLERGAATGNQANDIRADRS